MEGTGMLVGNFEFTPLKVVSFAAVVWARGRERCVTGPNNGSEVDYRLGGKFKISDAHFRPFHKGVPPHLPPSGASLRA